MSEFSSQGGGSVDVQELARFAKLGDSLVGPFGSAARLAQAQSGARRSICAICSLRILPTAKGRATEKPKSR